MQTDVGVLLLREYRNSYFVVVGSDATTASDVLAGDFLVSINDVPIDEMRSKDVMAMLKGVRGACLCSLAHAMCFLCLVPDWHFLVSTNCIRNFRWFGFTARWVPILR